MKKYLSLGLALLGIGLFSSCKSQNELIATFSDLDGKWNIVELNGQPVAASETAPFVEFDVARRTLSGNAGCNRMMGQVDYSEARQNIIKFPQVSTTRMACPDMKGEQDVLQALNKVVRFAAEGDMKPITKVALFGTDNAKLMVIEKQ